LLDYAFKGLDFRRVSLEVLAINTNAIKLYEKLGFVREGIRRKEFFLDGKYLDSYIYGLLSEDFSIQIPPNISRLIYTV
jgi:RimJ/RimL family protein N-acetyltransferase